MTVPALQHDVEGPPEQVQAVLSAHRRQRSAKTFIHQRRRFRIYPDVFSPIIAPSGQIGFAFSSLPLFEGKVIADVGCGSGIFASLFALGGARRVICSDINPRCLENTRENAEAHGVFDRMELVHGSTLSAAPPWPPVDIVYADVPFMEGGGVGDGIDLALFDDRLTAINELLDHLSGARFRRTTSFICWSDLDRFDLPGECRRRGLAAETFLTLGFGWINLALWRVRQT